MVECIIKRYKRIPIITMWVPLEGTCTLGYTILDKYKIVEAPFDYCFFNAIRKIDHKDYTMSFFPYYLTDLLINGFDIKTDEEAKAIMDKFNSFSGDKNSSQIDIEILEKNKKWKFEDKRWLRYLEEEDFEIHGKNGNIIYVSPNKFTLERIN